MEKRFYVVEKQLSPYDGEFEETTGWKTVTLYDIDAQAMDLVEVCQLEVPNSDDSVEALMEWLLENGDDREYKFVKL
jgi:hypothetical protein